MENENRAPSTFKEKAENFWYYYKWHTVVALFLVFAIVICSLQMCQNTTPDVYVMYAGGKSFVSRSDEGETAPHLTALSSLRRFADDYNGDGEIVIELETYYIPTAAEVKEIEDNGGFVDTTYVNKNKTDFNDMLVFGDYLILVMSEELFKESYTLASANPFAPLAQYASGSELNYLNDYAVYLNSTALGDMPVFSDMPADTVVCFRVFSEVALFRPDKELYAKSEEMLRNILK